MVRCQSGIMRMNCIDCLDRTNVVQVSATSLGSDVAARAREWSVSKVD